MKKTKMSLQVGLLITIVICWLVPILIVVTLAGMLLGSSYQRSVQQEVDVSAENALQLMQMQLEDAIDDSKAVSYDGVVRSAYRSYLQNGDHTALYSTVNDYLSQNFTREEMYQAVFIYFRDVDASAYVLSDGTTSFGLLRQCRESAPRILEEMADADTDIRFFLMDGQLYMARNLLDSTFTTYASVVMMFEPSNMLRPLNSVNRVSDIAYSIDGCTFRMNGAGTLELLEEEPQREDPVRYSIQADEHEIAFTASRDSYDLWEENPWLHWAVMAVALMVLPLLVVMIVLFYHNVTRPMETLARAHQRVQTGDRGYEITQAAPNSEFGRLFDQFNAMSTELHRQFERSYLEQQATQRAQIKALQSQINPHFLNNTLEIINWEARLAENDRVSAMIEALSTMLDAALDRDGRTQIPLSEELGYVDAYLYIIQERLGDGFHVHKQIDPKILDQLVPRLILQPIVENAVEHDITARRGGNLWVRAYSREDRIVLEVEHDGTMTEEDQAKIRQLLTLPVTESRKGGQVGLRNVNQRLNLIYGEEGKLTVGQMEPGAILARVTFPVKNIG